MITVRGSRYRARVRRCLSSGEIIDRSKTFRTKSQARAWERQIEQEIESRVLGQAPPDKRFSGLLEIALKKTESRSDTNRLNRLLKKDKISHVLLRELSPQHVVAWRDRRSKEVSAASVLREWNTLSSICSLAIRELGWLQQNPFSRVKRPKEPPPRHRRISDTEIEKLCYAAGYDGTTPKTITARVAVALLFAVETAMRTGEICGLTWKRVNIDRRLAHLAKTKNGHPRDVPLSKKALALIEKMRGIDEQYIFALTAEQTSSLFRKIKKRVMIDDLHFHDSRREALSRMAAKVDVMTLAKISGHRDLRILQNVYYAPDMGEVAGRLD